MMELEEAQARAMMIYEVACSVFAQLMLLNPGSAEWEMLRQAHHDLELLHLVAQRDAAIALGEVRMQ